MCVFTLNEPDKNTLVVRTLPQRSVALISDGVDVGWNFPQVMSAVSLHCCGIVQTRQTLIWVYSC